jgi:polar amino acid transport system substrate-binding protein
MKKWIALLVAAMMLMAAGFALAEDASVQAILDKGTLVLGLDDSFPPMGYRNEANEIVGFDIDVAKEVAARMGVELVPTAISWDAKELELSSGNIDCIWNGMSITPAREESMSMTFSYLNNQMVFYAMKDSGIASLEDLAGKKVAVQSGSYAEELLNGEANQALTASFAEVLAFDEYLTALMDLEQGGVDAVLIDKVVAEFRIAGMGAENIVPVVALEDDNYGIGFRKEDVALRDKVQSILVDMKKDGSLGEISTVWFGSDITSVPAE